MHPKVLADAYRRGENITSLLRTLDASDSNSEATIETAYDLQAGSYVAALSDPAIKAHKAAYGAAIAAELLQLTEPTSLLEAGVGEGTTLSFVLQALAPRTLNAHGFDLSWSRIATCRDWLASQAVGEPTLAVASLLHLPYASDAFDVVYTSHTIEPNGGNEAAVLRELYRVTSRYLVLLEPGYELASDEARARMERLGYCRNLPGVAASLGMKVTRHELFAHSVNPLNPTALTIIEKAPSAPAATPHFACPNFGDPLVAIGGALFSPDSLRAYPTLGGIPCLRQHDAVIASAFARFAR
jgi:SAM-dependent methyltransferase